MACWNFLIGPVSFVGQRVSGADALYVVYPGLHRFPMGEGVEAVPLWGMLPGVSL